MMKSGICLHVIGHVLCVMMVVWLGSMAHGDDNIKKPLAYYPPVIVIPGLTSSNLSFTLTNSPSKFKHCPTNQNKSMLWPFPTDLDLNNEGCFIEAMGVMFDEKTNSFHNKQGETTDIYDFGGFGGFLGNFLYGLMELGFVIGETLFGAPYDFRVPVFGNQEFVDSLTELVETVSNKTGNKVVLLAPSYGPMYTISFLHRKSQEWKDKYVDWFIAESPVWSGTPLSFGYIASGFGPPIGMQYLYRLMSTETYSNLWLWPRAGESNVTYSKNAVLGRTPSKNYTAYDVHELFHDLGFDDRDAVINSVVNDTDLLDFKHPGVNTYVTFGYGLDTGESYTWKNDFVPNKNIVPPMPYKTANATETGDSVVPVRSSMRAAFLWEKPLQQMGKRFLYKGYYGQSHALCAIPEGGSCFFEVVDLICNNITPPQSSVDEAKDLFSKLMQQA
eukprot:m.6698 g.6698  ORF g.6698 m.6698 type:complete len:444 (-) comp2636_c0_seq1:126-1457(-)